MLNFPILIPLPNAGFDPTEVSIPWSYLTAVKFKIVFATPEGQPAQCDIRMLTGKDLGLLKSVLMNDKNGREAYHRLEQAAEFQRPISYAAIRPENYSAIVLPGGHDKPMKIYLESPILQQTIVNFFANDKPVGAICHGTLLVGRSISEQTGRSVLFGRKTTGLTRIQELAAYYLTCLYLGDYYRTYPEKDQNHKKITMEDELKSYLKQPTDFIRGPNPLTAKRDNPTHLSKGFTVRDGNYLSARWPGDAHRFAAEFVTLLKQKLGWSKT